MATIEGVAAVKSRNRALYSVVVDEIRRLIDTGVFPPGSQLPPERDLTESLGVSRVSLREALRVLEADGVLSRRHGVGTFVNEPHRLMTSRLDLNYGVSEIIEQNGARAATSLLDATELELPEIAARLGLRRPRVARIDRIRTADGRPVAYTRDYIAPRLLTPSVAEALRTRSLYACLEEQGVVVTTGSARIIPVKAGHDISASLGISPDSVMLMIEQLDFTSAERPVIFSQEYHVREAFEFTISRIRRPGTTVHSSQGQNGA